MSIPPQGVERAGIAAWLLLSITLAGTAGCNRRATDKAADGGDSDALVIATDRGRVRGTTHKETDVFRGIPYAAPPVGELRFRPPEPHAAWEGVRDATAFGSACPQLGLAGKVVGDEDCLTLNIWRPSAPAARLRPVMVFIHGGANVIGFGSHPHHDGRHLAQNRDVIVVTINYRLGLLGFLAHPQLTAESGTSGNWAYLDQIAALEWVSRNIAAFGGDPDRVTIFGQSAGALSVCVLLASPLAAGAFDAAIMQSGGCDVAPLARRESEGEHLARTSGCALESDPIACLRGLPAEQLVELAPAVVNDIFSWTLPVGGAVDGYVLPVSPWDIFAAGTHNVVPTMVGSNTDEMMLFTSDSLSACSSYELAVQAAFGPSAGEVLAEYPCSNYPSGRAAYVDVTTDALFNCQARRLLRSLAPAAAAAAVPLFRYYYSYERRGLGVSDLKAFHGAEIQLLFGTMTQFGYDLPEEERMMSDIIQASWTGLAADGSPIHDATPGWDVYDVARDNAVIFDSPVAHADGVGTSHCDFWDSLAGRARALNAEPR